MKGSARTYMLTTTLTLSISLSALFPSGASDACEGPQPLSVTAPKRMEALNGSCLEIPCTFTSTWVLNSAGAFCGFWFKTNTNLNNLVFQSCETYEGSKNYPMNITGELNGNNCTTLFSSLVTGYTDKYRFRLENTWNEGRQKKVFEANAVCDPVQITVNDSPPSPTLDIPGELKEKQNVIVTCWAATPCPRFPPKLTWSLQRGAESRREENADGTLTTKIQKTITLSDEDDGRDITCSASYPVNGGKDVKTAERNQTLIVSYAPKNTSAWVSPEGPVSAGSLVNLSCSSRARPPVSRFTWFKKSNNGPLTVSEGDFHVINVTDGGVFYCVATNDLGNQTSSEIQLVLRDQSRGFDRRGLIAGGVIGILVLLGLVAFVWWFKSKDRASKQTQSQAGEEKDKEEIHYGEINFTKKPEATSGSAQVGTQEGTVYAQVQLSKPSDGANHTAQEAEDVYAQVKKN